MILGLFLSIALLLHQSPFAISAECIYDIVSYGAISDGETDSSKALSRAWSDACQSPDESTVLVSAGKFLVNGMVTFGGPCNNVITFQINGTLMASSDYHNDYNEYYWLLFQNLVGLKIHGGPLDDPDAFHLDGQGEALWNCKNNGGHSCPVGPNTLGIMNSQIVSITKVKLKDSKLFHVGVYGSQRVSIRRLVISAPNSPNTDGIHVEKSQNVTIANCDITTGDDCVSIGPGTTNLLIRNIHGRHCHGISIGSLGRSSVEEGVEYVTVTGASLYDTQNGLRIKAWGRESTGFAKHVSFQDVHMFNVANPLLIDKNYCPGNENCPNQLSGVEITDITYRSIEGTSSTLVAMRFDCRGSTPCLGIKLENINLRHGNEPAQASCSNAKGASGEAVEPNSCLS